MPFTNVWSVLIPPGTLPANQIDTAIQQTRLDIAQRINQILGSAADMDDDPIINGTTIKDLTTLTTELATKSVIAGLVTGRVIIATSATTIGSSSVTDTQLGVINQALLTSSDSTATNVSVNIPNAQTWLIYAFAGSVSNTDFYLEAKTDLSVVLGLAHAPITTQPDVSLCLVFTNSTGGVRTVSLDSDGGTGTYSIIAVRLR